MSEENIVKTSINIKEKLLEDFNDRLEVNDKEFSIEKDGVEEDDTEE